MRCASGVWTYDILRREAVTLLLKLWDFMVDGRTSLAWTFRECRSNKPEGVICKIQESYRSRLSLSQIPDFTSAEEGKQEKGRSGYSVG